MSTENTPVIHIDGWLDELPLKRMAIIAQRALREARLEEIPEVDSYDMEFKYAPAFVNAARKMYADELLYGMALRGLIEGDGVDEEGSVIFKITEAGEQAYQESVSA